MRRMRGSGPLMRARCFSAAAAAVAVAMVDAGTGAYPHRLWLPAVQLNAHDGQELILGASR